MKHTPKFCIPVLFLYLFIPSVTGQDQNGQRSYVKTDSSNSTGLKLSGGTDRENAEFIKTGKDKNARSYTPYEATEYGLKNGRVYVSKEIRIDGTPKKVFLERLNRGKLTLYYLKTREGKFFYSEKDSTLAPVVRKDPASGKSIFRDSLAVLTDDCNQMNRAVHVAVYKKKSLSFLAKKYNDCLTRPLPYFKYGLVLGYNSTVLKAPSRNSKYDLSGLSFSPDKSFSVGVFCDLPLYIGSFYFHPEIYFNSNSFLYNQKIDNIEEDIIVNSSTLNMPLLLKYAFPLAKIRPFVNAGCMITYDVQNKNAAYESLFTDDAVEINKLNYSDIICTELVGFSGGAGCEADLGHRMSVSLELRYNALFPVTVLHTLKKNQLDIFVAFAF